MKLAKIPLSFALGLLFFAPVQAAQSQLFKDFLDYVAWHQERETPKKGRARSFRMKNPFDHSFGKKSIFGRLYQCMQQKEKGADPLGRLSNSLH